MTNYECLQLVKWFDVLTSSTNLQLKSEQHTKKSITLLHELDELLIINYNLILLSLTLICQSCNSTCSRNNRDCILTSWTLKQSLKKNAQHLHS